ncbi:MAG TPA: helix-turn-helix transcriptional regulator, partial [Herpetosiphonaceae bacterium]|nr:helix-turn-helix transcriptional regulator [Herpetosiphonaceae bacterium]
ELAKHQGLTIKALAARAGVAYNTAHSLYTSRATRIDLDTLDRICDALRVEPGDVLIRRATQEPAGHGIQASRSAGTESDWAAGASDRDSGGGP